MRKLSPLFLFFFIAQSLVAQAPLRNADDTSRKTLLIEHYTGEWCYACPLAEPILQGAFKQMRDQGYHVEHVAYHVQDRYSIQSSSYLLGAFVAGQRYAVPAIALNRGAYGVNSDNQKPELAFHPSSIKVIMDKVAREKDIPEVVEISSIEMNPLDYRSFETRIIGKIFDESVRDDLYLTAVVVEGNLDASRQTNKQTVDFVHEDIARMFLTSYSGIKITPAEDNSFSVEIPKKIIDSSWKKEDTRLLVWVHRNLSNPMENRRVYTTRSASMASFLGVDQVETESIVIRVENGRVVAEGPIRSLEIYTPKGERLASDRVLSSGEVYVIRIEDERGEISFRKLIF